MKHVKVLKWKETSPDGKDIEVDTLKALNVLLQMNKDENVPKGLDGFRMYHRLAKAFDVADKEGILTLESVDYKFLKDIVEKTIPPAWGFNKDITNAMEEFLNAKE